MRIFLTGASGVVGRRVVPILVGTGHRVTAIGRSPESRAALQRANAPRGCLARERSIRQVASGILVDAALKAGAGQFIQESFAPI